jgi:DNA-binding transcriptional ArsR family regulator
MDAELLSRELAETYAGWFRALSDPSRVQILHLLAATGRPMPVGEIVSRVHIGQSTVSHHLAVLAETRFVLVEKAGTARLYRVNEACISCFPSAADVVMGRVPATAEEIPDARG